MNTVLSKTITIGGTTYTITSEGKVYGKSGKLIRIFPNRKGYACFTAGSKKRICVRVHRLVAKLFVDNPNNYEEVDHLDADRMNANMTNLEWVTHKENVRRAFERGSYKGKGEGEWNSNSKINKELVMQMRVEYKYRKMRICDIARKHNLKYNNVFYVVKGMNWKHIPMPTYPPDIEKKLEELYR